MSIISGYQKIKKHIKTATGYQLLSHWTSSDTVEMNDGTTLEQRISNVDNTSDQDKPVSTPQQNALNQKADTASPTLTGMPTAPTPPSGTNSTQIATTAFVQTAVSNGIAASDAMIIKGTIGTTGTVTALPTIYQTGWTYRVVTDGTYAGQTCEIGDLIIALTDRNSPDGLDSDWCVAQTNINGAITGIKSGDAYISCQQSGSVVTITHNDVAKSETASAVTPSPGESFTAIKAITSDEKGHLTGVDTETVTLPTHPTISQLNDNTSSTAPDPGSTFTAIDRITRDSNGHVTQINTKTVTLPSTSIPVDNTLSSTSRNPVENQVINAALQEKLDKTGDAKDTTVTFSESNTRTNIANGDKLSILLGKISKFFSDLKTVAFTGSYHDLSNQPTIPTASTTTPKTNGTATVGSENKYARGDHVHPLQTSVTGSSGSCSGNAATATKLATARSLRTNLASTTAVNFDGSANITPGVTGTLPVANGGTGKATLTANQVLVGNGTSAVSQRAIDTTAGGTVNSTSLITSGAVKTGLDACAKLIKSGTVTTSNVTFSIDTAKNYLLLTHGGTDSYATVAFIAKGHLIKVKGSMISLSGTTVTIQYPSTSYLYEVIQL